MANPFPVIEDPFELFFNNKSLSDRILKIVEIEEVLNFTKDDVTGECSNKSLNDATMSIVNGASVVALCKREENIEASSAAETCTGSMTTSEQISQDDNDVYSSEVIPGDASIGGTNADVLGIDVESSAALQSDEEESAIGVASQQQPLIKTENSEDSYLNCDDQLPSTSENGLINLEKDVSFVNLTESLSPESTVTVNKEDTLSETFVYEICTPTHAPSNRSKPCSSSCSSVIGKKRKFHQADQNDFSASSTNDVIERHVINEVKVFVHSVILAAKSSYFRCLFSCGMRETNEKEIKIEVPKGEINDMLILLHCFYNKQRIVNQPLVTVSNVCNLAMRFCFDGLITTCLNILCSRATSVATVDDINIIVNLASKIQSQLPSYKVKCSEVSKACVPTFLQHFLPIDEMLEKTPAKFYSLPLNTMYLFLEEQSQRNINEKHGNLFVYSIQQWLKYGQHFCKDDKVAELIVDFIRKFTEIVDINFLTGDFLINIMTYEHSPLNAWCGYKDWYIKALQSFVYKSNVLNPQRRWSVLKRRKISKFVRHDNNADIFALQHPVILNGFEISVYLRVREDFKMHVICKCKNMLLSKKGFGKSSLVFNFRGSVKLNINSNIWIETFPTTHEWLSFSYKANNSMFAEVYPVCKLRPDVYNLAKTYGFILTFQMQQIN